MPSINPQIAVEEQAVLRNLGYRNKNRIVPAEIAEEVGVALAEAPNLLAPELYFAEYLFRADSRHQGLLFAGIVIYPGQRAFERLCRADSLVLAVSTIGSGIGEKCAERFAAKDALGAMIYDAIGIAALTAVNQAFWRTLKQQGQESERGITQRFAPGEGEWDIQDQKQIFTCLGPRPAGVTLTESFLMQPVKSTSAVYGLGRNIESAPDDHNCAQCQRRNCQLRRD